MTRIGMAFIGCGYVADLYGKVLEQHPDLNLVGVFDRDRSRREQFARKYATRAFDDLQQVLNDPDVAIVLNLTNPDAHFQVSRRCLEADKHVYSEKPLALSLSEARELVDLAGRRNLRLAGAPCSLLGETAQTLWKAVRESQVGQVHAVYAELDDGLLHRMPVHAWSNDNAVPWPIRDEIQVGNALEHAGYYLSWLAAFFGPAVHLTAATSLQVPDKLCDLAPEEQGPDFTVSVITFASGVVARLTCTIVAERDHSLRVFGDDGVMGTDDCWYYRSPVWLRRRHRIRRRVILTPWRIRYPLVGRGLKHARYRGASQMDWLRGVADMKQAIDRGRPHRLSAAFSLHVCEMMLAIHESGRTGRRYDMTTTFPEIEPMPWAVN